MLKTGEMLNMLNRWGEMGPVDSQRFTIFNISAVLSIFQKTFNISPVSWVRLHETGEMLKVFFFEKCLKKGKC